MLAPLIRRSPGRAEPLSRERGVTMALVAVSMFAMIGMAALSIDLGTLFEAKAEAQRAADSAALAAARVISLSGITGDPNNADASWGPICGGAGSPASLTAINVAQQNLISGAAGGTITVLYGAGSGGATNADCSGAPAGAFGINPVVSVKVQRANLPVFFAKVFSLIPGVNYSNTGVSATAVAEVFNPSNSGGGAAVPVPVQARCVKPWVIANSSAGGGAPRIVDIASGQIYGAGIYPTSPLGTVGRPLKLQPDCAAASAGCNPVLDNPPVLNLPASTVDYVPALIAGTPVAVKSCSTANPFQQAIGGCDENTVYSCGVPSTTAGTTQADLTENPVAPPGSGDTTTAGQCLINQSGATGQDMLAGPTVTQPTFPFQILAGADNPLVTAGVANANDIITVSNSVATVPIAEFFPTTLTANTQPNLTIVGFLQVFITGIDAAGNVNVIVLNVSGCGAQATGSPVYGTSPVPIRLITPP